MPQVRVRIGNCQGPAQLGARIDDDPPLAFDANCEATAQVAPGVHFLIYFAWGQPGVQIQPEILAPPEAVWSTTRTIPKDGIVIGWTKFKVS